MKCYSLKLVCVLYRENKTVARLMMICDPNSLNVGQRLSRLRVSSINDFENGRENPPVRPSVPPPNGPSPLSLSLLDFSIHFYFISPSDEREKGRVSSFQDRTPSPHHHHHHPKGKNNKILPEKKK